MKIFILLLTTILISCSHSLTKDTVTKNIGEDYKYYLIKNKVVVAPQPEKQDIESLIEIENIKTVINLRDPSELEEVSYNEEEYVTNAGLNYFNLPIMNKKEISSEQVDKIESTIKEQLKSGNVLVHCSTGNRAAAWLASHMKFEQGLKTDEAIEFAKKSGLNNEAMLLKTRSFLDRR